MKFFRVVFSISVLALAGVIFAIQSLAADDAGERKKLEGTWQGFVVEGTGQNPKQGRVRVTELVITADKISAKGGQGESLGVGSYKLGATGNAKTIDSTGTGGPTLNKSYQGIYTVEGDTLKWCAANPGRPRPTQLVTRPPDQFLMVLTRKK